MVCKAFHTTPFPVRFEEREIDLRGILETLAGLGYEGVEYELGSESCAYETRPPFFGERARRELRNLALLAEDLGLQTVVSLGGRHVAGPERHRPTLFEPVEQERRRKRDLLLWGIDAVAEAGFSTVLLHSGLDPSGGAWDRGERQGSGEWALMLEGLGPITGAAAQAGVRIAFEPHPEMLVRDVEDYRRLRYDLGSPRSLGLCIDIGHLNLTDTRDRPVAEVIREVAPAISDVHIDQTSRRDFERLGRHEHFALDDPRGDAPLGEAVRALDAVGYRGLVGVELKPSERDPAELARRSLEILRRLERG